MIFDLSKEFEVNQANDKLKYFISKGYRIELTRKLEKRSISQNNYLHLIFSWFGLKTGYTLEEVKQDIYKKVVNPDLFYLGEIEGKIKGVTVQRWRSTADLNTSEMTLSIDRFRNFSATEVGEYLPEPKDLVQLLEIERELSKNENKVYL